MDESLKMEVPNWLDGVFDKLKTNPRSLWFVASHLLGN